MERFVFDNEEDKGGRNKEEADNSGLHDADLYDQDEDGSGEKVDLVTGKPIDNSTQTGLEDLRVVNDTHDKDEHRNDAAAKWLRENDPDLK